LERLASATDMEAWLRSAASETRRDASRAVMRARARDAADGGSLPLDDPFIRDAIRSAATPAGSVAPSGVGCRLDGTFRLAGLLARSLLDADADASAVAADRASAVRTALILGAVLATRSSDVGGVRIGLDVVQGVALRIEAEGAVVEGLDGDALAAWARRTRELVARIAERQARRCPPGERASLDDVDAAIVADAAMAAALRGTYLEAVDFLAWARHHAQPILSSEAEVRLRSIATVADTCVRQAALRGLAEDPGPGECVTMWR
jgi:hypothetical protein